MADLTELGRTLGVAGGGAAFAVYIAYMLIRFQKDFTERYSREVRKLREERDAAERKAYVYAMTLARNGIPVPVTEPPSASPEAGA